MSPTGHLAIGFIAKRFTPETPVFVLLIAAYITDIVYFCFLIFGSDAADYSPWTHSLFMAFSWSVLTILIAYFITKKRRVSLVLGIIVFSHWILDFIVHSPDLPILFRNSPELGLGLWTSGPGLILSLILELVLLIGGIAIYLAARKKKETQ